MYLTFQVTFIFLTQIYYNMNFIILPSDFTTRFLWHFQVIFSTQKMHISEYACKTFLKELGILLNAGKSLKNFLHPATLLKLLVFHKFFSKVFWTLYFKNINFLTKTKKCLLCWLLWIQNYQMTGKYLTSNTTFSKKVNPIKYPIQTYILVRIWNLLKKRLTQIIFSNNICSGIKIKQAKKTISHSVPKTWFFSEFLCSISSSHFRPFSFMCAFNRWTK